jgi:putative ABC transport system permease protein
VSGRDFIDDDYRDMDLSDGDKHGPSFMPVILTETLAHRFFPDGNALGGTLNPHEGTNSGYVVVGIVRHLLRYELDEVDDGKAEYSVLMPSRMTGTPVLTYVIRTNPTQRDAVLKAVPDVLKRELGSDMVRGIEPQVDRYEDLRASAFKTRRAAVWLLGTVNVVITLITLLGISSLTGYWIEQRTRQIGIRRALGATKGQILRYFQTENFLLTTIGLLIGLPLAFAVNQWLMRHYEFSRLPWQYLLIGAASLWVLGQLSVWWPARRATKIPPAIATRSA